MQETLHVAVSDWILSSVKLRVLGHPGYHSNNNSLVLPSSALDFTGYQIREIANFNWTAPMH